MTTYGYQSLLNENTLSTQGTLNLNSLTVNLPEGVRNSTYTADIGGILNSNILYESGEPLSAIYGSLSQQQQNMTGIYNNSIAISQNATGIYNNSLAISQNMTGIYNNSIAISQNMTGIYNNSLAISQNMTGIYNNALAISQNATGIYNNSIAISQNATGVYNNSLAISQNATGIYNNALAISDLTTQVNQNSESGVLFGLELSINSGDNTKFDILSGSGAIVDITDPNGVVKTQINYAGSTANTVTNLASHTLTNVFLDSSGSIIQKTTMSPEYLRDYIFLGVLYHQHNTIIEAINDTPTTVLNGQFKDFCLQLAPWIKLNPVRISTNNNLTINHSQIMVFKAGINYHTNPKNPNLKTLNAKSPFDFLYMTESTIFTPTVTNIDPNHYDVAGVKTTVSNNRFTNQRIYSTANDIWSIQYGPEQYNKLENAIAGIETESFTPHIGVEEQCLLIAILTVKKGVTNLSNALANGDAFLRYTDYFGNILSSFGSSAGGSSAVNYWTLTGNDIENNNSGLVIIQNDLDVQGQKQGTFADSIVAKTEFTSLRSTNTWVNSIAHQDVNSVFLSTWNNGNSERSSGVFCHNVVNNWNPLYLNAILSTQGTLDGDNTVMKTATIGTTNVASGSKLSVYGGLIHITSDTVNTGGELFLYNNNRKTNFFRFISDNNTGWYNNLVTEGCNSIIFGNEDPLVYDQRLVIAPWQNTARGLVIDGTGKVGINESSPDATLTIRSDASSSVYGLLNVSNLSAGQKLLSFIGKDLGVRNGFWNWYYHIGDGSDQNKLAWDAFGFNNILTLKANGSIAMGGVEPDDSWRLRLNGFAHFGDSFDPAGYGCVQITRPPIQNDTRDGLSFIRAGNRIHGIGYKRNSSDFKIGLGNSNSGMIEFTDQGGYFATIKFNTLLNNGSNLFESFRMESTPPNPLAELPRNTSTRLSILDQANEIKYFRGKLFVETDRVNENRLSIPFYGVDNYTVVFANNIPYDALGRPIGSANPDGLLMTTYSAYTTDGVSLNQPGECIIYSLFPGYVWKDMTIECRNLFFYTWGGSIYHNGGLIHSDDRLKDDERHIENALNTLMKVRPQIYKKRRRFTSDTEGIQQDEKYKLDPYVGLESGVIAQQVYYNAPELRHLIKIPDDATDLTMPENYDPEDPKPQVDVDWSGWGGSSQKSAFVNYEGFIPYLIQAVQELKAENDKVKAQNDKLRARVKECEEDNDDLTREIYSLKTETIPDIINRLNALEK